MVRYEPTTQEMARIRKLWGWTTEEQIKNLTSKQWTLLKRGDRFDQYRLVAEVVEARNCLAGAKEGDRYVFHASGFLLPQESSTRRFCLWAMAPMLPFSYMVYDRIANDLDPSSLSIDLVECTDVGVEHGGYGKVRFRIYCQEVPPRQPKR